MLQNIELKNSVYYYEHLEEKVIDMVREFGMEDRVIFSSFNLVSINKCKKLLPEVPMGYLMEARMDNMGFFTEENGVEYYHPDKKLSDRRDGAGLSCAWDWCQCVDSQQKGSDETVKQLESRRHFHEFPGSRKRTGT